MKSSPIYKQLFLNMFTKASKERQNIIWKTYKMFQLTGPILTNPCLLAIWCASWRSTFRRNLTRNELLKMSLVVETSDASTIAAIATIAIFLPDGMIFNVFRHNVFPWFSYFDDGDEIILVQVLIGDWKYDMKWSGGGVTDGLWWESTTTVATPSRKPRRRFICALWRHRDRFFHTMGRRLSDEEDVKRLGVRSSIHWEKF